jgi:hypothetical protein
LYNLLLTTTTTITFYQSGADVASGPHPSPEQQQPTLEILCFFINSELLTGLSRCVGCNDGK